MGFAHLDRYADHPSWLTGRTTPKQRLWIAIAAAFAAGLMPPGAWGALGLLAVVVALGVLSARLPATVLARRLIPALPFFLLPALALPFSIPGPEVLAVGPFVMSRTGLIQAAEIIFRATLAVTAVTVIVSVTRASDLLNSLDGLPLPTLVKSSLALGYRYVYVLNDELERTRRALQSRSGPGAGLRMWRARATALAHLILRAHARTSRLHFAMLSRGYSGSFPTLRNSQPGRRAPTAVILALLAAIWAAGLLEVTL